MDGTAPTYTVQYRNRFLMWLTAATFLPLVVSVFGFEVLGAQAYAATLTVSVLALFGGAHVWITLAYYFERTWQGVFAQRPFTFYVAPAVMMIASVTVVMLTDLPGVLLILALAFVNLWHHARQNWGILALVGKARRVDVRPMRIPLTYAWVFFVVPWGIYVGTRGLVENAVLYDVGIATTLLYVCVLSALTWRYMLSVRGDRLVLLFSVSLALYFVPMVALYGKPYALLVFSGAHALQYYLIVLFSISQRDRQRGDAKRLRIAVGFTAALLAIITLIGFTLPKSMSAQMPACGLIRGSGLSSEYSPVSI